MANTSQFKKPYNDRLFAGGVRRFIHLRRFYWLRKSMGKLNIRRPRIIELGCYDAKTILYLNDEPEEYLGLDANWEGGLENWTPPMERSTKHYVAILCTPVRDTHTPTSL